MIKKTLVGLSTILIPFTAFACTVNNDELVNPNSFNDIDEEQRLKISKEISKIYNLIIPKYKNLVKLATFIPPIWLDNKGRIRQTYSQNQSGGFNTVYFDENVPKIKERFIEVSSKELFNSLIINPFKELHNHDDFNDDIQIKELFESIYLNNKDIKVGFFTKLIMKWDRFGINLNLKLSKKNKYYESIPGAQALTRWIVRYAAQKGENSFDELKEKFTNEIIQKVKEVRNNALISCFSKRYDSILMWSHYGDKHKGICVEFDRPDKDFLDVKYSKKRCKFDFEDTTRRVLGYMLSNEEADVNDKGLIRCISKPFIVKSLDWQYEEEVRCILSPNSDGVSKLEKLSLYTMPTKITKIYVGCKVDKESAEYNKLLQLAKTKGIDVIELIESDVLFGLESKGGGFND